MKTKITILTILFSISAFAGEPASFGYMLRGYCYAGNQDDDMSALGGYGRSVNLPQKTIPEKHEVYLKISDGGEQLFADRYESLLLHLVNGTSETLDLDASDSRISIIQQAMDKNGEWRDIEYLPSSWCGNSYHSVYLPAAHQWIFIAPKYSGPFETQIRFKIQIEDAIIVSSSYRGGIHRNQFTVKQGHNPTGIMDPYNE